ncbi:unnamed protein product [Caenorhabditis sp. 36 PRJEB53466]|nr:unnamed protein product [Caenorhabditis sp. 36 PRJEB53466]
MILLVFLLFVTSLSHAAPNGFNETEEIFSAAPNNTPITKVYIFGKPVYIREPFVLPQRNLEEEQINFSKLFEVKRKRSSYVDEAIVSPDTQHKTRRSDPKYPLKQCYTESSGFMCCNQKLEKVMHDTVAKFKGAKACNLQKVSTMLQANSQRTFGTEFEALTSVGDFASKIHFYSDFVCKMERDGRTMLVYATPNRHNYAVPYQL